MSTSVSPQPTALRRAEWLEGPGPGLLESTVGGLLREQAAARPDTVALVATRHDGTPGRWTYAELLDEASRVAGTLHELAGPGGHVAIWAPNIAEWTIVQYAAGLAGVVLVALNPALRPGELEYALTLSRSTVLLHADRVRNHDLTGVVAEVAPGCRDSPTSSACPTPTGCTGPRSTAGPPTPRTAAARTPRP